MNKLKLTMPGPSLNMTKMLLMLVLSATLIGCGTPRSKIVVISEDKRAVFVHSGESFTPQHSGYFIPDARMIEILDALDKDRLNGDFP